VKITFWFASGGQLGPVLTSLTNAYNASQQKVKVTLIDQQGYDDILAKYRSTSVADRPTLVQLPDYDLQLLADSKTIIPVQSCVNAEKYDLSDYTSRAISYWTVEGALQAMPFNLSNPILYYNKADFQKAGLDPNKPPLTIDDLRADSEKIVASHAAKYGIAVDTNGGAGGSWYIEQWLAKANQLYANNGNGRNARATNVVFNSTYETQLLTQLQQMVKDGLAINVGNNPQNTADLLKLADPKEPAAMTIHTSASLSSVINLLKGGKVSGFTDADLGIGPMPAPAGPGGVLVGGAALWLVKGKSEAETAAAWDFAKYLTSPASQATWAAGTGYVPIRTSALEQPAYKNLVTADPRYNVAYQQLAAGVVTPATAGPVLGPQSQVRSATAHAMESIYGGTDVKTALDGAAKQADSLIADYNRRTGGG
jgi:sn-glycerol 3-phosphate transport system substrate-binding protein